MRVAVSGFLGISSLQARPQNWNVKPKRLTDSPFSIGTWNCPEAILTSGQLMEGGTSALEAVVKGVAVEEAIQRILSKQARKPDFQVGFIAINIAGEKGAYSIHKGFSYTYYHSGKAINVPSASVY